MLKLLEQLDSLRRPERLDVFLKACEADKRGRPGYEDAAYPQGAYLHSACAAARAVTAAPFLADGLSGTAIGDAMRRERIGAISKLIKPA